MSVDADFTETLAVADDGWTLIETGWDRGRAVAAGSNFLVGNGYLGYRGTSPEQVAHDFVSLVVTDTYDCADGRWRELATAPNPLLVAVSVDGEVLSVDRAETVESRLDMRNGRFVQLVRHVVDRAVGSATIEIEVERFASYATLHLLAQRVTVRSDVDVEVVIEAGVDADVWNLNGTHIPTVDLACIDNGVLIAHGETAESGVTVGVAARITGVGDADAFIACRRAIRRHAVRIDRDAPAMVETVAAVASSNDVAAPLKGVEMIVDAVGYDEALAASAENWSRFWDAHDVVIDGSPLDDAALRFSAYHNRICTPAHTDHLPIGARGLSCQAYQGSAFWDQEVYNLPAFLFTEPEIARSLLVYRYRTLDGARRKADRLGYDGAYYAWVSGETGDELCPDVFFTDVLTGREIRNHFNVWQMHVAPDVVTTIARYVEVTGDIGFLVEYGAEIAFEVARFLRSFVRYDDWRGTYHCIRLLGPDEWHENVDDNAFTNHQAHAALSFALESYERLERHHHAEFDTLTRRLGLDPAEVERWRHVRDHLALPAPDADSRLVEQFAGFFALEDISPADLAARLIDPSEYWGWPNGIAVRTQVSKQADVAMLMWLHGDQFDDETVAANYDYYEPRCSHNSSLSHAAYGMLAARLGRADVALGHFRATARVDLLNTNHGVVGGTFIGGIHTAACGGTVQLAVNGIGGLGFAGGVLSVEPSIPKDWAALTYPVRWRGQGVRITVAHDEITITADPANDIAVEIDVQRSRRSVAPGSEITIAPTDR